MSVRGMGWRAWLGVVRVTFVRKRVTKENLKFAYGALAASGPVTERPQRLITKELFADNFRRKLQQFANVQEGKWPGSISGCEPTISVKIEPTLNCAGRAVEASQILRDLFQDSGRQFSLVGPG